MYYTNVFLHRKRSNPRAPPCNDLKRMYVHTHTLIHTQTNTHTHTHPHTHTHSKNAGRLRAHDDITTPL